MRRWLVLGTLLLAAGRARADEPVVVELWTMGPGDGIFDAFGHGTLCVTDAMRPDGRCYNYGTTDFRRPMKLVWDFVRGQARFWVSPSALPAVLASYTAGDRTIYRQRLPLSPEQARALANALERDLLPENRVYQYHHLKDNCSTRLRDHIDRATGGAFRAAFDRRPAGETFRQLSTHGYLGSVPMLLATELVMGYFADRQATVWEAMFLPDVLRASVEEYFGVKPQVENVRRGPVPTGDPLLGRQVILIFGAVLTALVGLSALSRRRWAFRAALVVVGLSLGLLGTVYTFLALASTMPEMRRNELLLVFLPLDLALTFLRGRWLRAYLVARLVLVAALAAAVLGHLLEQPLWAPLAVVAGPLAAAALGWHRIYGDGARP